ncbi:unnamed protein product [Effrenium voratum]|nr:unnamed protein product [Effrenium voratum]
MVGARDVKIGGGDLFGWLCQTSAKRPAEVIQAKKRDSEAKKLVWDFVARAPACELCSEEELRAFWARAQHLDKASCCVALRDRFDCCHSDTPQVNNLLAFLHFLVFMRRNERIKRIIQDLRDAHNTSKASIARWQKLYHTALTAFVESKNINKIGGRSERCAVDETAVSKVGKMALQDTVETWCEVVP